MRAPAVAAAVLGVLLVTAAGAVADSGGNARFTHGVTAGDVTASSAILWGHADRRSVVVLELARDRGLHKGLRRFALLARRSDDYTVQRKVGGLMPGTRYWYRFRAGRGRSPLGTFATAPHRGANATVEFAWTGDTDFNPAPGETTPFWNSGGVFARMRAERNDFNIHLGDTMYSDSEIPGRLRPIALSVRRKWAKYKVNLGNRSLRSVRRVGRPSTRTGTTTSSSTTSRRRRTRSEAVTTRSTSTAACCTGAA